MGEIVNLRRARKRRASAEAAIQSAANRVLHGVSKNLKSAIDAGRRRAESRLEAHRRQERDVAD
jgi:hypothetical protein